MDMHLKKPIGNQLPGLLPANTAYHATPCHRPLF